LRPDSGSASDQAKRHLCASLRHGPRRSTAKPPSRSETLPDNNIVDDLINMSLVWSRYREAVPFFAVTNGPSRQTVVCLGQIAIAQEKVCHRKRRMPIIQ
jgi:hypothetical protein